MSECVIEAKNFSWRHATRKDPAFPPLSFRINRGECILLSGASGAGKSTLLSAIAGVLGGAEEGEQSGSLEVAGLVGLVLQDPDSQVIASRVGDDVAFGCENLGMPTASIWHRVHEALALVGLDMPLDTPTRYLSGGQKQRLALAGVIAMGADIIILDEPTANIDPQGRQEVRAAVEKLLSNRDVTVLIVEHRTALWHNLATRFLSLDKHGIHELPPEHLPQALTLPPAQPERAQAEPLIQVQHVRTITNREHTFDVPLGASTVLTGPNGVGKTQLAMVLSGIDAPRAGTLLVHEKIAKGLHTPPHKWKSAQLVHRIGTVFQNPEHQFLARTVAEDLLLSGSSERAEELLHRLRLDHVRDAHPFTLSGGEKRRLSVATALMGKPELLVLDEPTFGQDPATFAALTQLLRELNDEGVSIFSITHDEQFIATLGDKHIHIDPLHTPSHIAGTPHASASRTPSHAPRNNS
ncbi:ABC transporter ATP-binding protein [Corynebacterium sp. sy017]|uniref:ABC transporter ATP-binding protein n=1 Tax=unclassified Corynebacterium TaxID=2624378 RepID=UPI001184B617|nr:ABC transporter ATP-binding protein [Corynebacterium sp. SY003]MBP3088146.1 ABC transporter ATP-binding protein [Corynebacterium sp. sy017]TSD92659.1 ABC transporter ATP-binding protein [Corynebacterium sp. SY003]